MRSVSFLPMRVENITFTIVYGSPPAREPDDLEVLEVLVESGWAKVDERKQFVNK